MPGSTKQRRAERRRTARFSADYRVVARLGRDALTTSTRDLSRGGMRLAYTGPIGATSAEFLIDLGDGEPPLRIRGQAVGRDPEGLRIRFEQNDIARKRIRNLIRNRVIPALEEAVHESRDPDRIDELAACLRDVGLIDDAVKLYRSFSPPKHKTTAEALTDIEELRTSILRQRRALYAGFQTLLEDRNRLRELTGEGTVGTAAPQEQRRLTAILQRVQHEMELLEEGTASGNAKTNKTHLRRYGVVLAGGVLVLLVGITIGRGSVAVEPSPIVTAQAAVAAEPTRPEPTVARAAELASRPIAAPTSASRGVDAILDRLASEYDEELRRARARNRGGRSTSSDLAAVASEATEPPPTTAMSAPAEPVAAAEVAPTIEPAEPDPDYNRALRYLRDRKVGLAVVALQRVVARTPNDAEAHRLLGLSYVLIEQRNRARVALQRFLDLEPNHPRADQARKVLASLPAP